ncbi:anther-specific protein LAT52-like [Argentina anserina]|uniref:anther-specific protein LAT52-like n=1 Tax=Argentina anserina TaxID=57926 RepID=UPI0021762318|nr:anther-specific protein LAT52-like [Potentilla anserina]
MAKTSVDVTAVVLTVLCLCYLANADGQKIGKFFIEGKVYCDPCRVQFQTRISEPIDGATVELACKSRINSTVFNTIQAKTNKDGLYTLLVDEDYADEICEVKTVSSPRADCNEHFDDFEKARVLITYNNGVASNVRYANPLGFMKKEAVPECEQVLKELFPEEQTDEQ